MTPDRSVVEQWMSGQYIPGIAFSRNEPVEVGSGMWEGGGGAVVSLLALEPEPIYLVRLGSDADGVPFPQSALRPITW